MSQAVGVLVRAQRCVLRVGLVLCAFGLAACPDEWGNGERASEERALSDFTAVDNSGELDVLVEQGEQFEVTVSIDDNLIDRVDTYVVGDTLRIRTRGEIAHLVKGPHVRVTMPALTGARVSGSGELEAFDFPDSEAVDLQVSGSGGLSWQGTALELTASVSGSGDLALEGSADVLELRVSGAGDARARSCEVVDAYVKVSGAGDASVNVSGELEAEVSGAGDLTVYGHPHFARRTRSGAGDIHVR